MIQPVAYQEPQQTQAPYDPDAKLKRTLGLMDVFSKLDDREYSQQLRTQQQADLEADRAARIEQNRASLESLQATRDANIAAKETSQAKTEEDRLDAKTKRERATAFDTAAGSLFDQFDADPANAGLDPSERFVKRIQHAYDGSVKQGFAPEAEKLLSGASPIFDDLLKLDTKALGEQKDQLDGIRRTVFNALSLTTPDAAQKQGALYDEVKTFLAQHPKLHIQLRPLSEDVGAADALRELGAESPLWSGFVKDALAQKEGEQKLKIAAAPKIEGHDPTHDLESVNPVTGERTLLRKGVPAAKAPGAKAQEREQEIDDYVLTNGGTRENAAKAIAGRNEAGRTAELTGKLDLIKTREAALAKNALAAQQKKNWNEGKLDKASATVMRDALVKDATAIMDKVNRAVTAEETNPARSFPENLAAYREMTTPSEVVRALLTDQVLNPAGLTLEQLLDAVQGKPAGSTPPPAAAPAVPTGISYDSSPVMLRGVPAPPAAAAAPKFQATAADGSPIYSDDRKTWRRKP